MADFQVKLVVERLDENGDVEEIVSNHVLAEFPDDTEGMKSDNFFNCIVIRKNELIR